MPVGFPRRSNVHVFSSQRDVEKKATVAKAPPADSQPHESSPPSEETDQTIPSEPQQQLDHEETQPQNPILKKIRDTLAHSDPARWLRAGEVLDKNARHKQTRERWERVYALEIAAGTLSLRESTPVQSKYVGGGYQYLPQGLPHWTVELRAKGWNPRELVDPEYRVQAKGVSSCDTIVSGMIARELFVQIDSTMRTHASQVEQSFRSRVDALLREISVRIAGMSSADWISDSPEKDVTRHSSVIDGIRVEVLERNFKTSCGYALRFHADNLCIQSQDGKLAQQLFEQIVGLSENARLSLLSDMLESSLGATKAVKS